VFYKPAESVVLLVPVSLLIELGEECEGYHCPPDLLLRTIVAGQDRTLHTLTEALIQEDTNCPGGQLYLDTLGTAIVFYLLNHYSTIAPASQAHPFMVPGDKRIQRAQEYIDAHLKHPISLIDLAHVAGLSRMYFAAEFRRTTGLRPHEYLLRQRVNRAKHLLVTSDLSLTAIAPMVGFENAGHLCTVFKRFVGESPVRWRHLQ
jgi:AraC-like DNA-binding protein